MSDAVAPWIQTYSGVHFDLMAPRHQDVRIEDIGHALSNLCRFTGHSRRYYSVAQHCVLASYVPAAVGYEFETLLHDAAEAYCNDLASPLKYAAGLEGYKVIEKRIDRAVRERFDLPSEESKAVKLADRIMLATEARDLLGDTSDWALQARPLPPPGVQPWRPEEARRRFFDRFVELYPAPNRCGRCGFKIDHAGQAIINGLRTSWGVGFCVPCGAPECIP